MPFDLPTGYKFSCFALEGVPLDIPRQDPIDLGNGLWVVFEPPFDLSGAWREWLGSLEADRLKRCNVALLAVSPSQHPEILDEENKALTEKALGLLYGLFMVEVFRQDGGIAFNGANVAGQVKVRQTSRVLDHYALERFQLAPLRAGHFLRAAQIAEGIRAVHSPGTERTRLQRGFHAWIRGVQELYGDERLHQFVRAIEAVIKPAEGKGRQHFAYRCQLFVGESVHNETMLTELFNMRGETEHLNSVRDALEEYPAKNRITIAHERLCQAQLLASYVYERILSDSALRALFSEDERIAEFWQRRRNEQREVWKGRFDWIRSISSRYKLNQIE